MVQDLNLLVFSIDLIHLVLVTIDNCTINRHSWRKNCRNQLLSSLIQEFKPVPILLWRKGKQLQWHSHLKRLAGSILILIKTKNSRLRKSHGQVLHIKIVECIMQAWWRNLLNLTILTPSDQDFLSQRLWCPIRTHRRLLSEIELKMSAVNGRQSTNWWWCSLI